MQRDFLRDYIDIGLRFNVYFIIPFIFCCQKCRSVGDRAILFLFYISDSHTLRVFISPINSNSNFNYDDGQGLDIVSFNFIINQMNAWERLRKSLINTKNKSVFAIRTVFSSKKSIFRWALAINVGALLLALAAKSDESKAILTKQVQYLSDIQIPVFLRPHIYGQFAKHYQVDTNQIQLPFKEYPTLSSFFIRKINRQYPQQQPNTLSSPCDGKILSFSEVKDNDCHLIKGKTYSLTELVFGDLIDLKGEQVQSFLKRNDSNKVYQIVIYLAPRNYHRFHSPVDIKVLKKLSIPGRCDPVHEKALLSGQSKYQKNGRISVFSEWKGGLLTMVMVGALNVSRIHIVDASFIRQGEQLGYFNLGSTIVLVAEAKDIKKWKIKQGDEVRFGDPLFEYIS